MRLNRPVNIPQPTTHEGAPAARINAAQQLRRSVMSCLLWEKEFYEEGEDIAGRIRKLVTEVPATIVSELAIEARHVMNLRHVPLFLTALLCKTGGSLVGRTIERVVDRADELAEFLAIYAAENGVTPDKLKPKLSNQVRKGLAAAFQKFDEYALGKYNRARAIKLSDVMRLCHPKPRDEEQNTLWHRLLGDELKTPDTWEVALSAGADKRSTFERLLKEGQLGYLALLRNLRNMQQAGCDPELVRDAILARKGAWRVLPFRYVAAARAAPQFEPYLDQALQQAIALLPELPGRTIVLVDVSGSMDSALSAKSDMRRLEAAAALASVINAEDLRVFTFSERVVEVPPRRGMAGVDAVIKSQIHSGTKLGLAVNHANAIPHERLIVISDEQTSDRVAAPVAQHAYMINVASYKNGVGYGSRWTHIDGFSENVLRFIQAAETQDANSQGEWGGAGGVGE